MAVVFGPNASVLASDYSIASVGTYEDIGLSVVIPAGVPEATVFLDVRGILAPLVGVAFGEGSWIAVKLVADDGSTPYDVPNSDRLVTFVDYTDVDGGMVQSHKAFHFPIALDDTSLTTTIKVFAIVRGVSAGSSISNIQSNSDGLTVLSWTL